MTQSCTTGEGGDAAVAVLRLMVTIADSTVEKATGTLTLTQFRVLRTAAELTPVTVSRVAADLATTPSTVTRACDRLLALGLIQRAQNPLNRREVLLAPTAKGRQLTGRVDLDRRAALTAVLDRLDPRTRADVVAAFAVFTAAAALIPAQLRDANELAPYGGGGTA